MTDGRWFGNLLGWEWSRDAWRHFTWHNGRAHNIAKVDRQTADAMGGGMAPGWHIQRDEPHGGWSDGWGPSLGRTAGRAKRMAEAWIIFPYDDLMQYPQLIHAVAGSVMFMEDSQHVIYCDDAARRFTARRGDTVLGHLVPVFTGPAGDVAVTWSVQDAEGRRIAEAPTWQVAVDALKRCLATPV